MDIYLRRLLRWQWFAIMIVVITTIAIDVRVHMAAMSALKDEITAEKAAVNSIDREQLKRIQADLEEEMAEIAESMVVFQSAVSAMSTKVIQEKNVALLTQEIIKIADNYRVELSTVRPMAERAQGDHEVLPMSMNFKTQYASLFKFLDAIEASPSIAGVEGLTINAGGTLLDVQLTVYTLFKAQTVEADAAGRGTGQ
ncbi:MAG: type 4a pilus biogenesis protein PilO [Candidatus Omnitrophica bacterium]|nr:type 4a pilus biogenesis protein PilO [Candidatus Omnitrophota bacterium]